MKILQISLLVFTMIGFRSTADQLPKELSRKLRVAISEHCPDAHIEMNDSGFIAKYGTMIFTLHNKSKTGEVFPQTYQEEGPNFKGFLLKVSLIEGPYQGAAVIPQSLKKAYFITFIDAPPTENGQDHYWVRFSFGSRFDEKTRKAILNALPKTKFQSSGISPTKNVL